MAENEDIGAEVLKRFDICYEAREVNEIVKC